MTRKQRQTDRQRDRQTDRQRDRQYVLVTRRGLGELRRRLAGAALRLQSLSSSLSLSLTSGADLLEPLRSDFLSVVVVVAVVFVL